MDNDLYVDSELISALLRLPVEPMPALVSLFWVADTIRREGDEQNHRAALETILAHLEKFKLFPDVQLELQKTLKT
ncbi:MAG: hypothetical protein Q8K32_13105 [Archangium sp.]|nr:hypothetical protein [Archangium sp.]